MGKKKIITDRVATLSAVRRDGSALHYVSKELKADREVVLASVRRQTKMSTSTKNRLVASADSLFLSAFGRSTINRRPRPRSIYGAIGKMA